MDRRRAVLVAPLLALVAAAILAATLTGRLDGSGRVVSRLDGAAADGGAAVSVVTFHTDPNGDWITATVPAGHTLLVRGYGGEPALRVAADGTCERNANATVGAAGPDDQPRFDDRPQGDPEWVPAATSGQLVWHDHRAHWYAGAPEAAPGTEVATWSLPIEVDGVPAGLSGVMVWEPPSAGRVVGALAAAAGSLAALFVVGRRRPGVALAAGASAMVLGSAVELGTAGWSMVSGLGAACALVALAAVVVGSVGRRTGAAPDVGSGSPTDVLAAALLAGWLVPRWTWAMLGPAGPPALGLVATLAWAVAAAALVVVGIATVRPGGRGVPAQ